jgi:nucleoside triphosphatase
MPHDQVFPEPTVGGLIFNPKGEILILKSHKWNGVYSIPGGHIELGERMEDALVREVKEETGLDVYDLQFLLHQEFIYDDIFWQKKHFIFFDFACKTDSTDVVLDHEAEEFMWVSVEEALKMPLEPYLVRAIEVYKEKNQID